MRVVVLGAGLMGSATAFFLARRGIRVTLVDRGRVGACATVASFGNIRRSGRHLSQLPLAARSLALWHRMEDLTGRDVEFRATGHLRLIYEEAGLGQMRDFARAATPYGLVLQDLSPEETRRRHPWAGPGLLGASFSEGDGSANPRLIAPALAQAAARLGVEIVEEAAVTRIDAGENGFRLATERGEIAGEVLVNCAGFRGPEIAAQFGETVPLAAAGPQMGVTEPLPWRIEPVVGVWSANHGAYFRQVERGNIVFGGEVARRPVDPETGLAKADPASLAVQIPALIRMMPALADVTVIRQWSGPEGYVGDMLPVMGASDTTPGLFHAFGFCGHGFQLGPGVGDVMAELIATGRSETPIASMRIGRFAESPQAAQNLATLPH